MRPEDLDLLRTASAPSLTPDGRVAVCAVSRPRPATDRYPPPPPAAPALPPDGRVAVGAVSRPSTATDRYPSALWVVPTDGSSPRRLTSGPGDSAPAVSPDG